MGEAFQRHNVAVLDGGFDSGGKRRNLRHCGWTLSFRGPYLRPATKPVKWRSDCNGPAGHAQLAPDLHH
jgi:hypothetical protein